MEDQIVIDLKSGHVDEMEQFEHIFISILNSSSHFQECVYFII